MMPWDHGLARIERAEEHLEELKLLVAEVLDVEARSVLHHVEPETGYDVWEFPNHTGRPFWRVSILLADVAHSLRTALNNLAYSITGKDRDFPIFLDSKHRSYRPMRDVFPEDAHSILDRLQPDHDVEVCPPNRHPLWIVHRLDVIDKHMRIVIAPINLQFPGRPIDMELSDRNMVQYRTARDLSASPDLQPPTFSLRFSLEPVPGRASDYVPWESIAEAHQFVRDEVFPSLAGLLRQR